jgi:hypothetical protein
VVFRRLGEASQQIALGDLSRLLSLWLACQRRQVWRHREWSCRQLKLTMLPRTRRASLSTAPVGEPLLPPRPCRCQQFGRELSGRIAISDKSRRRPATGELQLYYAYVAVVETTSQMACPFSEPGKQELGLGETTQQTRESTAFRSEASESTICFTASWYALTRSFSASARSPNTLRSTNRRASASIP